jgi:hypothetical protein
MRFSFPSSFFGMRVLCQSSTEEPGTGVSDMIPGTLRSKSMVRSRALTDEGAPTCRYGTVQYGVATPGSRTISGSPLLAVLISLFSSLIHCPCVLEMKHQKSREHDMNMT